MTSYPFRFYGRHPVDWAGDELHQYDIKFASTPTCQQKGELACCYTTTLATGGAVPLPGWQWSEGYAQFSIAERWPNAARMAFSKVTDFLLEAHWICPIADVVFWGLQGGSSRWDRWTLETQANPDPGPRYKGWTQREVDPSLPEPAPDEAFEAALEEAIAELRRQHIGTISSDGDLGLEPIDVPQRDEIPEKLRQAFNVPEPLFSERGPGLVPSNNDGDHIIYGGPRPVAKVYRDKEVQEFVYRDDAGHRQRLQLPDGRLAGTSLVVDREGTEGLACNGSLFLYSIDFSTGQVERSWQSEEKDGGIIAVGFIGELWVVRTYSALLILDPCDKGPVEVTRARLKGDYLTVVRDETVVVTGTYGKNVAFYGFAESKLKKLGGFKVDLIPIINPWVRLEGRVVLSRLDEAYVVTNLDEVYEAFALPLREKAERARQRALKKKKKIPPKLSLATFSQDDLPDDAEPVVTQAEKLMLGRRHGLKVRKTSEGLMAALLSSPNSDYSVESRYFHFVFTTKEGPISRVHDLTEKIDEREMPMSDVGITDDGQRAFIVTALTQKIFEIDLAEQEAKVIYQGNHKEGGKQVIALHVMDRDNLLLLRTKRLDWFCRHEEGWIHKASTSVSSPCELIYNAHHQVAIVRGTGKKRAQLFALRGAKLLNLGAFTERIELVLSIADRVFLLTVEDDLFLVMHIEDVAQHKSGGKL